MQKLLPHDLCILYPHTMFLTFLVYKTNNNTLVFQPITAYPHKFTYFTHLTQLRTILVTSLLI